MPAPRILLASSSARRIEMLRSLGIPIETRSPDVDETRFRGEKPAALVARLARAKARAIVVEGAPALVIAADTIVVAPNGRSVLGKPANRADALKKLRALAGRTHTVLTGYCIRHSATARERVRVVRSRVRMRELSSLDIEAYFATGESMDKAGAYAAQGFGAALIESLSGSYTNVVGLPLAQLLADLENDFGLKPFRWGS